MNITISVEHGLALPGNATHAVLFLLNKTFSSKVSCWRPVPSQRRKKEAIWVSRIKQERLGLLTHLTTLEQSVVTYNSLQNHRVSLSLYIQSHIYRVIK